MIAPVESRSRRRLVLRIVPLALFAALALLQTWPVAAHIGTRVPGTATWAFDESTFVWNIWNFKHSLLDLHVSPLHSDLIWRPLGIDLILYTYDLFNALIGMPLLLAFSPALASNITVLLAIFMSGLGAYLLALDLLRRSKPNLPDNGLRMAALVSGVVYAFAANRAIYAALGHYDMVTTQWLAFYALYFLRTLRRPTLGNAALAGLFFVFAALSETTFAAFLALLSALLLLASWRGLRERRKVLLYAGVAALVAVVLWSPLLVPIVREFVGGNYALEGWGESVKLSADAVGLVTPTNLNPMFGGNEATGQNWRDALRAVEKSQGRFSDINTLFLGWVTLALALLGAFAARRKVAPWIWVAVVFGILALGPLLQINGRFRFSFDGLLPEGVTFPLPFVLLHYIPFISANRAPNRNGILLMLALAVLAGFGVSQVLVWLGGRRKRQDAAVLRVGEEASVANTQGSQSGVALRQRVSGVSVVIVVLLTAAILIEHLSVPMPTTDATIPAVYRNIASEPGDFAIMQLPLGWRNSFGVLGSEQTNLQYFQTAHGKSIIGGNISRAPAFKMEYFGRIPLFKALTDLEMYKDVAPDVDAAARAQAGSLMSLYNVRYLVTTPPIPGRYPYQDTWQRTEQYALDVLPVDPTPVWEADGYRVYRVNQPAATLPLRLDLGTSGNEAYLGEGWDARTGEQPYGASANWVASQVADLYLPMPASFVPPASSDAEAGHVLRAAVAPLSYPGATPQTVQLLVNDRPQGDVLGLKEGWQTVEFRLNDADLRPGPNNFRLRFGRAESPREVAPDAASRALIGTTGVQSPVNLELHGFSEAFMTATDRDGQTVEASTGREGYNVAVFDQKTGRLLDKRGFDTAANASEPGLLAEFLNQVPPGRIVALATKGPGTANLTPAALAALRSVGSKAQSLADLQGQSHALVGVKGSPSGSASEVVAPDAYLRVAGDFRTLAAAVDSVEWGE